MGNECEKDHRTGHTEAVSLHGKCYDLLLTGEQWKGRRWKGLEYSEAVPNYFWYEGMGAVYERASGEIPVIFTFQTWEALSDGKRYLKDFVLASDRWHEEKLTATDEAAVVDLICETVIAKRRLKPAFPLLEVEFGQLRYQELVDKRLVFDESGQRHLRLA